MIDRFMDRVEPGDIRLETAGKLAKVARSCVPPRPRPPAPYSAGRWIPGVWRLTAGSITTRQGTTP